MSKEQPKADVQQIAPADTIKQLEAEKAQLQADNQNLQQTCMALQTTVRVLTKMVP